MSVCIYVGGKVRDREGNDACQVHIRTRTTPCALVSLSFPLCGLIVSVARKVRLCPLGLSHGCVHPSNSALTVHRVRPKKNHTLLTFHESVYHSLDTAHVDLLLSRACTKDMVECKVLLQRNDGDLLGQVVFIPGRSCPLYNRDDFIVGTSSYSVWVFVCNNRSDTER